MTKKLVWVATTLAMAATAAAQPVALDEARVRNDLQAGNIAAAAREVENTCRSLFDEARDRVNKTVVQRARLAEEALACVNKNSAATVSYAPSDKAFQTSEALKVHQREVQDYVARAQAEEEFLGLKWGIGLGFSTSRSDAVNDAEIVNGVVRVKSELKQQPRAVFEFHKYFWCNNSGKDGTRGCGPFVAAAATEDKILSGVGLGFMYGMKSTAADPTGFSIGIGAILDGKVKDLADGFKANEPPPNGETSVRYKEKARWSTLVFVTRTF